MSVASQPVRRQPGLRDMALSLAFLLAIIGVVLAVQHHGSQAVKVIDPSSAYAGARAEASFHLRTPEGLPTGWRPTSARTDRPASGRLRLTVGFVTPQAEYAQLVESDLPPQRLLSATLSAGVQPRGTTVIGTQTWQVYPAPQQGDRAIARTDGAVTFIVSGSAALVELRFLAASLR